MVSKICFDVDVCTAKNISVQTALYLLSVYFQKPLNCKESLDKCVQKGFVVYYNYNGGNPAKVELTEQGIKFVEELILDSEFEPWAPEGKRFENLADKLRELYPEGKKAGTQYYWRDSKQMIIKKLKALIKKYGDCFKDEDAIEATRKYVASFNGNYQYMQLLKYFILKNVVKGGEVEETSQLLSYIENMNQQDVDTQQQIDWETELR